MASKQLQMNNKKELTRSSLSQVKSLGLVKTPKVDNVGEDTLSRVNPVTIHKMFGNNVDSSIIVDHKVNDQLSHN